MTAAPPRVMATGTQVVLREKTLDDARDDYAWRRDPELAAYDAARPLSSSFRTFVSTMADDLKHPTAYRRTFAIEDPETGRHIGNVMYYGYDADRREAELGITIGDRDYWSKGYGSDATRTMVAYLFEQRGLERIYLHTLTWNHRAQAAFEKAGFRRVRTVERDGYVFELMEIRRREYDPDGTRTGPRLPGR